MEIPILAEGVGWLAVDKPPGTVVVPARGQDPAACLWRRLEALRGQRLWVVHRIDRDTSGVVLFATTAEAHRDLSMAFDRRNVHKEYVAFVRGIPDRREIDAPLVDHTSRVRVDPAGKESRTTVEVVSRLAHGTTLVRAVPHTGRRHQIRVHLAMAGAPLLFDPLYGGREPIVRPEDGAVVCDRLTLHAARLRFPAPGERYEEEVTAPLAPDLVALHRALLARS